MDAAMFERVVEQRDDLLSALELFVDSNDVAEMEGMAKALVTLSDNPDVAASLNALRVLIKVKNEIRYMGAA